MNYKVFTLILIRGEIICATITFVYFAEKNSASFVALPSSAATPGSLLAKAARRKWKAYQR
jgi:hypothetical protein